MFQSSKDFKPLNNNILVKPTTTASDDEVSDLGIVIKLSHNKSVVEDRPTKGIVVSKGPKVKELNVNDEVFWHVASGIDIQFYDDNENGTKGTDFVILREESILGYRRGDKW